MIVSSLRRFVCRYSRRQEPPFHEYVYSAPYPSILKWPYSQGSSYRCVRAGRDVAEGSPLGKGASERHPFTVPAEDLAVRTRGSWTLVPGTCTFAAARSSRDITAQRALTVR
jgi:hypothetical protein